MTGTNIPDFYANECQVQNTPHDTEIRFLLKDAEKSLKGAINIRLPHAVADELAKAMANAMQNRK